MSGSGRQYVLAAASAFAGVVAAAFVPIARETPGLTLLAVAVAQALTIRLGPAFLGIIIAGTGLTIIRTADSPLAHIVRIAVFVLLAGAVAAVRHGRRRTVEASEQYQMLFDRNPMPMWLYDDETLAFLAVNQAAIDTYGYTREEFKRMTLRDIRPEEDLAALERRPAKGLQNYTGTWRHRTRQGRDLEVLVRSHLVDNDGRPARLALLEDRTERTALERQLRHAQKMDAIGQLAGGMAHDFNNLLTAIFGYCDLLLNDIPAGDSRRGDVEEIRKAASAAASLTDRLLAFSRKQIIEPKVLDLNRVVDDMGRLLQRVIGEDVEMELNLSRHLASAEEAVRVSRAHRGAIDLLLSDVVMPGQSGPSLATQLKTERPEMRVLHMSGYTDDAVVRHGALSGTAAFLQKPFTPEGLSRRVQEVLSSQQPGAVVE